MAMIISLNIDAGNSRLRSRSLICFIPLKEHSAVAVDIGSTVAMVSRILMLEKVTHFASLLRNSVASSFNDKLFSSKMTNLIAFHSCLVSVLSTSAGVEKAFPSYAISDVSPKNFRSYSNSTVPYLCSCWTSVGHFCGSKMLKAVKSPKVSLNRQLICLLTSSR